jgi:glycosyltransferase involved in cell wall biosynthesis
MKNKSFFVFSQNFYPSSFADSVRSESIVAYLNSKGYNVVLYTHTRESKLLENSLLKVYLLNWANPTNNHNVIKRLFNEVFLGAELFFKILFLKGQDYYYLSSPPFISSVFGVFSTIFKRGKLILDIRDLYPDVFLHQNLIKSKSIVFNYLKLIESFLYGRSEIILAATDGIQAEILNRISNKKVLLLRNGYSKYFKISNNKFDKFTVVFHGSLSRFQNVDLMVDVIRTINLLNKNIRFIVIGSGPKDIQLKSLNLDNFKFLGRLSNESTAEIVNQCHLGLSLRDESKISIDAFPVKLYEYVGSGIPSITTPYSEGGRELEKLKFGFNLVNDLSIIVEKILLLESNDKLYFEMQKEIILKRDIYEREYITKVVFDKFLSI